MKALVILSVIAVGALAALPAFHDAPDAALPETVAIPAGDVAYRPLGNFSAEGKARTPAPVSVDVAAFEIMKYQVSRTDYAACVADGACAAVETTGGSLPQTHVSWKDATAYAAWLSDRTGIQWRLPTAAEWQRAAAERHGDAAPAPDFIDPGDRMLAQYANGVLLRDGTGQTLRPRGGYGENSLGVADISGSVWEWTDGCMENGTIEADGSLAQSDPYCGVRIAGGRHRAAIIDFVRDPSVGGCAVGLPPDYLGIRLVRDR